MEVAEQKEKNVELLADNKFSYIKGCITGDGWFEKGRVIGLATVDEDWALYFLRVLEEWSGLNPTLRIKKIPPYRDQFLVKLYNRSVLEFLKENEATNFLEFLKGLFDAEGCFHYFNDNVQSRKIERYISLTNSNLTLLNEIKDFLLKYNADAQIYKKPWRTGRIANRAVFPRRTSYFLQLNSNKSIFWFYKNVGFRIGRKQERLEEWAKWLQTFHTEDYLESKVYG